MININDFLHQIAENNNCGDYLRYDSLYDQIQESKREDDFDLSQGIWQTELKHADWNEVEKICTHALMSRTKDIQIAVWLTEAWIVLHNLNGLNNGILLITSLCEKFWDNIHPRIVGENFTARLAPLYYFAEKTSDKVKLINITNPQDSTLDSFCLADWMLARHNIKTKNTNGLTLKQINKSVITTSFEFFDNLRIQIEEIISNIKKLDSFITLKCGKNAPSFRKVLSDLEDIQRITLKNLSQVEPAKIIEPIVEIAPTENLIDLEQTDTKIETSQSNDPTLEQAYDALAGIADFLEKNQPQSPAYILTKIAYKIGQKSFQELLETNVNGGASVVGTISELYKVLWKNNDKA